ncbi:Arylsulfatase A family protein [Cupriavidus necator]|uniref:Arylsulfatase A family protein n=1 Tax=Cupriavidus necator TaxID=106590 RepID=A0A1K0ICM9_CUPNE|nr:Arylsulfatase A family protein [Cupriavidus necator]
MRRPSFVFILADDLGYADLGCTGARAPSPTPNLDRMAAEGMLFRHGYANSPVCSPTRFALITGRWQYRLRGAAEEPLTGKARGSEVIGLPPSHPTLPSLLRDAGYRTALAGKWHLGYPPHFGPLKSGYETFFGPLSGGVDYFSHCDSSGSHDLWDGDQPASGDGYLTDLITDRAVEFIKSAADTPFMLSVHYTAPHWPWETREDHEESRRIGKRLAHTDGGSLETYRRMVSQMDEGIGRILASLRESGADRDTLVVFTSDNGGERFSDTWPFVGQKMDLLEGGIRVPLVARWPAGIAAGQVSNTPVITMDWPATMLACAGVPAHPRYPLDGVDLRPLLAAPGTSLDRDLYWRMSHRHQRALRSGRWKYLAVDQHEYLFDLSADERERANLAARYPDRLADLRARWLAWASQMPGIPEDARVTLVFDDSAIPRPTH